MGYDFVESHIEIILLSVRNWVQLRDGLEFLVGGAESATSAVEFMAKHRAKVSTGDVYFGNLL